MTPKISDLYAIRIAGTPAVCPPKRTKPCAVRRLAIRRPKGARAITRAPAFPFCRPWASCESNRVTHLKELRRRDACRLGSKAPIRPAARRVRPRPPALAPIRYAAHAIGFRDGAKQDG